MAALIKTGSLTAALGLGRSLIPGVRSSSPLNILAGSMVLSAVGTCPPHDGVRQTLVDQCVKRVLLCRASQSQERSHQRRRPGRDVCSRWSAGTLLSFMQADQQPPLMTI